MIISKFEGDVRLQLGLEVLVSVVVQLVVVFLRVFAALCVGLPENVVGQHAFAEACVAWQGVSQLDVVLSVLFDDGGVDPFGVFDFGCFFEGVGLDGGELVHFFSVVFDHGLSYARCTSFTTILVSGTPTMLAAVRWRRSEGGRWLKVWEVTYLSLASKSCPLMKLPVPTSSVVLPKVLPQMFSGLMAGTQPAYPGILETGSAFWMGWASSYTFLEMWLGEAGTTLCILGRCRIVSVLRTFVAEVAINLQRTTAVLYPGISFNSVDGRGEMGVVNKLWGGGSVEDNNDWMEKWKVGFVFFLCFCSQDHHQTTVKLKMGFKINAYIPFAITVFLYQSSYLDDDPYTKTPPFWYTFV